MGALQRKILQGNSYQCGNTYVTCAGKVLRERCVVKDCGVVDAYTVFENQQLRRRETMKRTSRKVNLCDNDMSKEIRISRKSEKDTINQRFRDWREYETATAPSSNSNDDDVDQKIQLLLKMFKVGVGLPQEQLYMFGTVVRRAIDAERTAKGRRVKPRKGLVMMTWSA